MQGLLSRSLHRIATGSIVLILAVLLPRCALAQIYALPFSIPADVSQIATPENSPAITTLEPGKPIERELSGSQTHSYQVTVADGQHVSVIVEQRGIDVIVKCFGPDGKLIADIDLENRLNGEERAEL